MKSKNRGDERRKFSRNWRFFYAVASIAAALFLTIFLLHTYLSPSRLSKAAIIDQLNSLQLTETSRFPNQTFIETAQELLSRRFPRVDYYSDNATIDLYKSLPSLGYKLIIWRVHSALDEKYVAICSSEKYNPGKYLEYSDNQVTLCNITGDSDLYFAIAPKFVEECMNERFSETVMILMSCNGLKEGHYETAEAFKEKGVRVFISWDGWIDSPYNDHAITLLLDYLIDKNNTIGEAISKIPSYISPLYGPIQLDYYPKPEAANYHIPDYTENYIKSDITFASRTTKSKFPSKQHFQLRVSHSQNTLESILQIFPYWR